VIVDTDVVIWALRGNKRAAATLDRAESLALSVVSYMELVQGAKNKADLRMTRDYLADIGFAVLPLSENIGHRASIYLEEYGLKSGLGIPDALIAATAMENDEELCTGNAKHYRAIRELNLKSFRP
jgi:predicted nucleic acid-binding protein